MDECIFCKIARNEIKAKIVLEEKEWLCFEDLNPKAPVHVLVIPKKHYSNLHEIEEESVYSMLMHGVKKVVQAKNLQESGYRVVTNSGIDGGQSVNHLHFHIFGKRAMGWPPG